MAPEQGGHYTGSRSSGSVGRHPKGILPIVCARHHVLLVDELDAVDGAPGESGSERRDLTPPRPRSPTGSSCRGLHTALLVAVEDKLRLLGDFPHSHGAVPAPSRHAALPAQGIQGSHRVLVPKAGEGTEGEWGHR